MPMDFPDFQSLKTHAKMLKFRQPNVGETEHAYRNALADFVAPLDFVESQEIRTSKGWDCWRDSEVKDMLRRKAGTFD